MYIMLENDLPILKYTCHEVFRMNTAVAPQPLVRPVEERAGGDCPHPAEYSIIWDMIRIIGC